jgi:hypothetical protein
VTLLAAVFVFPLLKLEIFGNIATKVSENLVVSGAFENITSFISGFIKNNISQTIPILII